MDEVKLSLQFLKSVQSSAAAHHLYLNGSSIKINWSTLMEMLDNKAKTIPGNQNHVHFHTGSY